MPEQPFIQLLLKCIVEMIFPDITFNNGESGGKTHCALLLCWNIVCESAPVVQKET